MYEFAKFVADLFDALPRAWEGWWVGAIFVWFMLYHRLYKRSPDQEYFNFPVFLLLSAKAIQLVCWSYVENNGFKFDLEWWLYGVVCMWVWGSAVWFGWQSVDIWRLRRLLLKQRESARERGERWP